MKFIGTIINNLMENKGMLYYNNGDVYHGEFLNS